MTQQEIESLTSILTPIELVETSVDQITSDNFCGLSKADLEAHSIKFLVKLSIVPKLSDEKIKFVFNDKVMKNQVTVRALPPVEILIALKSSYPSHSRPLLLQTEPFYNGRDLGEFLIDNLNEKWSEEMPVLYEMAIYIQDEFLEQFFETNGAPDSGIVTIDFQDSPSAQKAIVGAQ